MTCILWSMATDRAGYGVATVGGKTEYAHRVAYCRANNVPLESIKGRVIRHSCDNPTCVNPVHLSEGTHADNVADKVSRNRQHSTAGTEFERKLTLAEREFCKANYRARHPEFGAAGLARLFGVSAEAIKYHLRKSK